MPPLAGALAVGAFGGLIASALSVPLAWMIGPLLAVAAAARGGMPARVPAPLRKATLAAVGVYMGSAFNGETAGQIAASVDTLLLMYGYVIVLGVLVYALLRAAAKFDHGSALCSAIPGGMALLMILGDEYGKSASVAVVQMSRLVLITVSIPIVVRLASPAAAELALAPAPEFDWQYALLLAGLSAAVVAACLPLRCSPSAFTITGIILSGFLHAAELIGGEPPRLALDFCLLIVGAALGGNLGSLRCAQAARLFGWALATYLLTVLLLAAAAIAAARWMDVSFWAAVLGMAPGGVAEMALVSLALQIDPPHVAVHQALRNMSIIALAPLIVGMLAMRRPPRQAKGALPVAPASAGK